MNLTDNPWLRLLTLCALYVAQGIPFGFITVTLAAYLADHGVGVGPIGLIIGWSTLPWAFKFLWGPFIDRFSYLPMGRRRPWILFAQSLMVLTIAAMIAIPDLTAEIGMLTLMVFVHNVFSSLQDVSVDALAVDLLKEEERGRVNGMMYGSSYLGAFIGGAGLGIAMVYGGLRFALMVQVGMLLAIMLLPLLLRERAGEKVLPWTRGRAQASAIARSAKSVRVLFISLAKAFSLKSTYMGAALALYVKIAGGVLAAVGVVFLINQLGWTKQQFTVVMGGIGVWVGLGGSIGGGFLADLVGAKRLAGIATVLLGLTWVVFSLSEPLWYSDVFVTSFVVVESFLMAVLSVSLFALFMGISWPVVAATQFTTYMALLNLSNTLGTWIAGPLSNRMSVGTIYLVAGIFQIVLVLQIYLIDPHETRRVLGGDSETEDDAQTASSEDAEPR